MTSAQYQLRNVELPNALRLVTNANPLLLPLGAISGIDATTLVTSVVVSAVANIPAETAAIMIQESWDGGTTWDDLPGLDADTITGIGTFRVKFTNSTNIASPHLRLKVTPTGAGSLYLTKVYCTTNNGQIIPRDTFAGVVFDFGVSSAALRMAAILGNAAGPADWNAGVATAQTLRVYDTAAASGLSTNHADLVAIQAQLTTLQGYVDGLETLVGTTNSTLSTISGNVDGLEQLVTDLKTQVKPEYSAAFAPVNGAGLVLVANTWKELVASTAAKSVRLQYVNDSGYALELGFGTASKAVLAEAGEIDLHVPAGTQLQLRSVSGFTANVLWLTALV